MGQELQRLSESSQNQVRLSLIETALSLVCLSPPREDFAIEIGFASDVLSHVLAQAPQGCLLVTTQSNLNVVAVASYTEIAGVIITSDHHPENDVLLRAREEGVGLYATSADTFDVVGQLTRLGLRGKNQCQAPFSLISGEALPLPQGS